MADGNTDADEMTMTGLRENIQMDVQQAKQKLERVSKKLQQSQEEVDKLAQKNVQSSSRLKKIKKNIQNTSSEEVQSAYDEALETQQRLFVMRGQMEKLQSEQFHLQDYIEQLEVLKDQYLDKPQLQDGKEQPEAGELIESVIQAQEAERHRLSRKIHDGPAQALSNFILQAEIAQRLFDMDIEQAREELDELKSTASATFGKVRDFIFELRPMMLDDLGLVPTLRHYIESYREQTGLEVNFSASGTERRLDGYLEIMIFRAVQELLSNASRHSEGDKVNVHIDTQEDTVEVSVEDDGKGFNVEQALEGSMGIKVIKDRVEILGGEMIIDTAVGQGTRIHFEVPAGTEGEEVFA